MIFCSLRVSVFFKVLLFLNNYVFYYSLAKEEELVAAKNKAEELEKENSNIVAVLAKKEQELDLRNQEKVST